MSPVPQFKDDDDEMDEDIAGRNERRTEKLRQAYAGDAKSQPTVASNFNVSFTRANVHSSLEQMNPVEINIPDLLQAFCENNEEEKKSDVSENEDVIGDVTIQTNVSVISELDLPACGAPLPIFTEVRKMCENISKF